MSQHTVDMLNILLLPQAFDIVAEKYFENHPLTGDVDIKILNVRYTRADEEDWLEKAEISVTFGVN